MVNKHVLRETFLKLESYDRVNVISDILRLSSSLELEFYSSVIESILQYHKLSVNSLKDELNDETNLKCFINSDCTDSNVRSKLISTLSLLKASNINGASQIFEFIRLNHLKFKEQAHSNPNAYEEVLLIYQLANDHPAFSFDHCQEIYDYVTQIKSISVSRDYFNADNNDEYVNDLSVLSIDKNDKLQYTYRIKVQWEYNECCIIRTLEDIYIFYQKICEMFPMETKNGEICNFYLSFIQDNMELSWYLMSTFFKDFLNSPQTILRCDYVRQFFKPRISDKHICNCDTCDINFNKLHWTGDRKFDPITKCSSPTNPSDNDEFYDNKTDTPCSSSCNFSTNSKYASSNHNLTLEPTINNRICSEDDSESSIKSNRIKTKMYHSTGSSPINTPSDDSEICSKNESVKNQPTGFTRQLSIVIENTNMVPSSKDLRTENWLSQSTKTITDLVTKSNSDSYEEEIDANIEFQRVDVTDIAHTHIVNLYDWLKQIRLHKYYTHLHPMNVGQFYFLTEETLNELGFVEGASKKLVSNIGRIKQSDIIRVDQHTIKLCLRERSNSSDSVTSIVSSVGDSSSLQKLPSPFVDYQRAPPTAIVQPYTYPLTVPNNYILFPSYFLQNLLMIPSEKTDQFPGNDSSGGQQ